MSDELQMPEVPEPKPEDPEDVSWALSTAEAMWARGDHSEGVKWVRRAAEAASDAENDERSLELAKAAADLAQLVTRRASRASIHIDDSELAEEPAAKAPPPVPPKAPTRPPPPKAAPAAPRPVGASSSITKQVSTPSRPPAPLPSSASRPPPAMGSPKVPNIGKPLGTNTKSVPPPPKAAPSDKTVDKKGARKSKTSLEAEAKAAGVLSSSVAPDTSPNPGAVAAIDETQETPMMRRSRPELGPSDPTIVGNINDLLKKKALASFDDDVEKTTDEWDAAATQNLTGEELNNLPFATGPGAPPSSSSPESRQTSIALGTPDFKSTIQQLPKPSKTSAAPSSARAAELHDPGIVTTQAVRVVVWRDGNGVHVAPAGTHVSAITVDAVLVALDGNADLTAWLTQKGR